MIEKLKNQLKTDTMLYVLAGISLIMGTHGYIEYYRLQNLSMNWVNALYNSLQLFVFNANFSNHDIPVTLNIARFFSPFLLATAIVKQLIQLTSQQRDLFRLKYFYKHHYIVCGLGNMGYKMAIDCNRQGIKVVVIEKNPNNILLTKLDRKGVILIIGDAINPHVLKRANIQKAAVLFALTNNDNQNIQISFVSRKLVNQNVTKRSTPFKCLIHITELSALKLLIDDVYCQKPDNDFYLKPFNINQIASSILLEKIPPYTNPLSIKKTAPAPLSLMIVGLGNMGTNLILSFALNGHYLCNLPRSASELSRKNKVFIVDVNAHQALEQIKAQYPKIIDLIDFQIVEHSPKTLSKQKLFALTAEHGIQVIYICLDNETERFDIMQMARQYLLHYKTNMVNVLSPIQKHESSFNEACNLMGSQSLDLSVVTSFDVLEEACKKNILVNEKLDNLAQRIHQMYSGKMLRPEQWHLISEVYKQSSRNQAEHIKVKIASIGLNWKTAKPEEVKSLYEHSPELVEDLAQLEHIRFVAERFLDGWDLATEQQLNVLTKEEMTNIKINATLKPYGMLDEAAKEFNRQAVKNIPQLIKS